MISLNNVKANLDKAGRSILAYSRNEIYLSMRFMDIALSQLSWEMNLSTKTIGIDGEKILFNPRHLIDLYKDSEILVNRAYMHMILHGLFGHVYHQGGRNETYWHLACDIAVASILYEMPAKCVKQVTPDFHQSVFDGLKEELSVLTAEGIYRVLYNSPISNAQLDMLKAAFYVDDHQFWSNEDEGNDQSSRQKQEKNEKQWQEISEKVQTGMETMNKEYGDMSGDLLYKLQIYHREKYDLRTFLRKFSVLKEEIKTDIDSFDYIFYTYGLSLYENMPLIEPLEYKENKKIQDFVIIIDTSQSCEAEMVRGFLTVVYDVLKDNESFFYTVNIHLIQCDVDIRSDVVIKNLDDLDAYMSEYAVSGGGGTDFRTAFAYVSQLIEQGAFEHLKGMLYFTDGYGQFPTAAPPYDTAFIFLDEGGNDIKIPPWAIKIILSKEELENEYLAGERRN